jgi:hypothetical protein
LVLAEAHLSLFKTSRCASSACARLTIIVEHARLPLFSGLSLLRPLRRAAAVSSADLDRRRPALRLAPNFRSAYTDDGMAVLTKQDIEDRFNANIARVRGLVTTYDAVVGTGAGRASVGHADVLRASVILLHVALEDLLRSIEELRLPVAAPSAFERFRFLSPGGSFKDGKEKFSLIDLAAYRGQSVDDVFHAAIDGYLEHSNYNNIGDVKQSLGRAGIVHTIAPADAATLEAMMKRRHWIAHRADVNQMAGRGHHAAQSIGKGLVSPWIDVVESFGRGVLQKA